MPVAYQVLTSTIAAIAVIVSVIAFMYAHNRDRSKDNMEDIRTVIREMLVPVNSANERNTNAIADINLRVAPTLLLTTDRLNSMSDRVGVLETKIEVFWKNVAYDAAKILHSPHTPELDRLLEKYQAQILLPDETAALADMLREVIAAKDVPTENKIAAIIILRVIQVQGVSWR